MKINIVPVWKQVTPELADELVAFWLENKALGDEAYDVLARRGARMSNAAVAAYAFDQIDRARAGAS